MTISVTAAYNNNAASLVLAMPDLSAVAGWPSVVAIPTTSVGRWNFTLEGFNGEAPCTENRTTFVLRHSGTF